MGVIFNVFMQAEGYQNKDAVLIFKVELKYILVIKKGHAPVVEVSGMRKENI